MKFLAFISIIALCTIGCVEGSANIDRICSSDELSPVSALAAGKTGTVRYLYKPNFGDAVSELDDFGNVYFSLKNISFSTKEKMDLSFVRKASISFVRENGEEVLLAETEEISGSTVILEFRNVSSEVTEAARTNTLKLRTQATGTMPSGSVTPIISVCGTGRVEGRATLSDLNK